MNKAVQVSLALTVANFGWQVIAAIAGGHADWMEAIERSFFQIVAVLIYTGSI